MAKPDPDQWTENDAVKLRTFISDHPKFLRILAKRRPAIKGDTMEARAVTGSDVKGFLDCIDEIEKMQRADYQGDKPAGFVET